MLLQASILDCVFQASFRMHGIKASRQIFLFERGVIIAKRKEDGMFSCKVYIPVSIPKKFLNFRTPENLAVIYLNCLV